MNIRTAVRWRITKLLLGIVVVATMLMAAPTAPALAHEPNCDHDLISVGQGWISYFLGFIPFWWEGGLGHWHVYLHGFYDYPTLSHIAIKSCPADEHYICNPCQSTLQPGGELTLYDNSDGTINVVIDLGENTTQMSATIHDWQGESFNPEPTYQLNDVVDGTSTTTLKVSLEELLATPRLILIQDKSGIIAAAGIISAQ